MPVLSYLRVLLGLEAEDYKKQVQEVKGETKEMQEGMKQGGASVKILQDAFTAIAGSAAVLKTIDFLRDSVVEAENAARIQGQLGAVLHSTGGVAGVTSDQVNDLANSLSKATGIEDDLIVKAEAMGLTFTNISKDIFPEFTAISLDMSAALDQDLKSSIIQVGKALQDPILGVTALRRVGVNFNEQQSEQIRLLVESGNTLEAQKYILHELQTEFGGTAQRMHEAGSGADTLSNSVGNLKEAIGGGLIPIIRDLTGSGGGWIDNLTASIEAENALKKAVEDGIVTRAEALDQSRRMIYTGRTAADVQDWLKQKTDELNQAAAEGVSEHEKWRLAQVEANAAARDGANAQGELATSYKKTAEEIEASRKAAREYEEAMRAAKKSTGEMVLELDTNLSNAVTGMMEKMDYFKAGGGPLNEAYNQLEEGLKSGLIQPGEQVDKILEDIYVQEQVIQMTMGNITADEAARNVANTLGKSLQDAYNLVQKIKNEKIDLQGQITMRIKYETDPESTKHGYGGVQTFTQNQAKIMEDANARGSGGWKTVPSGYPNDSWRVGMSSGEKYAVVAPGQKMPGGQTINLGGITINGVADPAAAYQAGLQAGQGVLDALRSRGRE